MVEQHSEYQRKEEEEDGEDTYSLESNGDLLMSGEADNAPKIPPPKTKFADNRKVTP